MSLCAGIHKILSLAYEQPAADLQKEGVTKGHYVLSLRCVGYLDCYEGSEFEEPWIHFAVRPRGRTSFSLELEQNSGSAKSIEVPCLRCQKRFTLVLRSAEGPARYAPSDMKARLLWVPMFFGLIVVAAHIYGYFHGNLQMTLEELLYFMAGVLLVLIPVLPDYSYCLIFLTFFKSGANLESSVIIAAREDSKPWKPLSVHG